MKITRIAPGLYEVEHAGWKAELDLFEDKRRGERRWRVRADNFSNDVEWHRTYRIAKRVAREILQSQTTVYGTREQYLASQP